MSNGCIEWANAKTKQGYGVQRINGRNVLAHRYAWERVNGPIPKGMYVCHRCDNPPCTNPQHLFLGTPADNMADKESKGRGVHPTGPRNGRTKLTADQAWAIRSCYAGGGVTQKELAVAFGVHRTTARMVLIGRTHKEER